jgi:hypothetical protein
MRARAWLWASVGAGAAFAAWRVVATATGPAYPEPPVGTDSFALAPVLLAMFVPYAVALAAARRDEVSMGRGFLVAVVAVHVVLAALPTGGSRDLYQYLFYGRMLVEHGANPHVVAPAAFAGDPWFGFITWHDQPSVYGPAWTAVSAAAAATGTLTAAFLALKGAVLALDLTAIWLLWKAGPGDRTLRVASWALNPLVLATVLLEAHADVAIAAAFLGALVAARRDREVLATALLTVAALVKPYAVVGLIVHLAIVGRRRGWGRAAAHAAGAAAAALLAYVPFLEGFDTFRGAGELAHRFGGTSLTGALYRLVTGTGPGVADDGGAAGTAILVLGAIAVVAALAWAVARARRPEDLWPGVVLVLATYLLLTPWFFPWHLVPLVALAAALPRAWWADGVLVWSASSLVAFRLDTYRAGLVLQTLARYAPPLAAFALRRPARSERGSATSRASGPGRP